MIHAENPWAKWPQKEGSCPADLFIAGRRSSRDYARRGQFERSNSNASTEPGGCASRGITDNPIPSLTPADSTSSNNEGAVLLGPDRFPNSVLLPENLVRDSTSSILTESNEAAARAEFILLGSQRGSRKMIGPYTA